MERRRHGHESCSEVGPTPDVVIVGAGLGGLTAGAALARAGRRVLVVESHDRVGGYATSFSRRGFRFDASLHNLGPVTGPTARVFSELGLHERVEVVPFEAFGRVVFPDHDLVIRPGLDRFAADLVALFPAERAGIEAVVADMRTARAGFEEIEALTSAATAAGTEGGVSPLIAVKYPQLVELVFSTFGDLLATHVSDPRLAGLLGALWFYFGLPPSQVAAILYAVAGTAYLEHAGGYVKGSSQALSDALAAMIEERGGRVVLGRRVVEILLSGGEARGVRLDGGEVVRAGAVVSNASAGSTFAELVDRSQVERRYLRRVDRLQPSPSAIQLSLGLDCPPADLGMAVHNLTVFSSYDHDENARLALEGDYARSFFSATAHSSLDPALAPPGKGVIQVFSLDHIRNWEGLAPDQYAEKKRAVTRQILEKVERHVPGLAGHVEVADLATPITMRRYTSTPEGAIFGPSQICTQSGVNRLTPETPVAGLYLAGASVYPGAGYTSVMASGARAAALLLARSA